jgi:CrcB protein
MDLAAVSIGAVGGALCRYQITKFSQKKGLTPWSTGVINIIGSTILGAVVGRQVSSNVSLLVGTGFCGAFTTFSTFSVVYIYLNLTTLYLIAIE